MKSKKQMNRRQFLAMTTALGAGAALAACAPPEELPGEEEELPGEVEATEPPPEPAAEEVELRYMSWWGAYNAETFGEVVKDFNEEFPNVNVKLEEVAYGDAESKYQTTLVSGTAGDILYHMNFMSIYFDEGLILELDDYYDRDGIDYWNDFYHGLGINDWAGKIYGFPHMFETTLLLYNKDMVKEYWGQDLWEAFPDGHWDTMDMIEVAKACTQDLDGDGRTDQWGLWLHHRNFFYGMETQSWTRGDDIFNVPECKFNFTSDIVRQMNHDIFSWVGKDGFVISEEEGAEIASAAAVAFPLQAEKTAMRIRSSTDYGRLLSTNMQEKFEWDLMYLPNWEDNLAVTRAGGHGHNIATDTDHPEEAWELVKFMGTTPGMEKLVKAGHGLPVYRKDPSLREILESGDYPDHREVLLGVVEDRGGYGDHLRFHNAYECRRIFENKLDVLYNEPYEEAVQKLDATMAEAEEEMNEVINYGDELPYTDIEHPFPAPA